jgi:hypothetical protein
MNCASGVIERANAASPAPSGLYPSISFWRVQKVNCQNIKAKLLTVSSSSYNWSSTTNYGELASILNAKTNAPSDFDALIAENIISNKTHLCNLAKVPTNFFEYTPYRGLDGVGPFTNDATVGHPHGWTNAYTVAGGSVFPDSRTNWYTTDYGWDSVKAVVNVLTRRLATQIGAVWNDHTGLRSYVYDSTNSFAEAKSFAEGSLTNGNAGTAWKSDAKYNDPYFYQYKLNMPLYNYAYTWMTNGAEPSISCLFLTYTIVDSTGYAYDGDQLGYTSAGAWFRTNLNEYAYGWQTGATTSTAVNVKTAYIGTTNAIPSAPASYPSVSGQTFVRGVGLRKANLFVDYMTSIMFLDYSQTDGFQFR